MREYGKPLPEARAVTNNGAGTWVAQGRPLPVYAQPLDEHVLDSRAFPEEDDNQPLNGREAALASGHQRREEYNDDSSEDRPSAEYRQMRRGYHGWEEQPRRGRRQRSDDMEDLEREMWRHSVVVIAEPRLGGSGIMKLAVLCFIYSCFALAMVIIHVQWVEEDEKLKEKEGQLSEENAAAKEEEEYEQDGEDDYWARRREERESQENFEILFRFFSFLVYMVIVLAQRAISNLKELYLKPVYVAISRFWISWTIFSVIILLVLDSMIEDKIRAEEEDREVNWDEYDSQVDAYNSILLTSDFINLFFFVFSSYTFHRTFLTIKRQQEQTSLSEPPSHLD